MAKLSHIDARGQARMVDVSSKDVTERRARAGARVRMKRATLEAILAGSTPKGDVIAVARTAGILAAKRTPELIPLCHPIALASVEIEFQPDTGEGAEAVLEIDVRVGLSERTGAEMEALTAASVAALTIYDMCKAIDRGMRITDVRLLEKSGGKSGTWTAPEE